MIQHFFLTADTPLMDLLSALLLNFSEDGRVYKTQFIAIPHYRMEKSKRQLTRTNDK